MRESTDFVDVTLFFEDVGQIEAHKVILAASKLLFLRFTRDVRGDSIVLGQYQFPGEPNGRIILFGRFETQFIRFPFADVAEHIFSISFSSPWVVQWLTRRAEEGLQTISRIGIDATFKVSTLFFVF